MNKPHRGSTLIIVLVLLTIMTFMGMALYRSSDLAGMIAGNVSSKQMATQVGDMGLAAAEAVLRGNIPAAAQAGFVPTQKEPDGDGIPAPVTEQEWSAAKTSYGYTYRYLIEKLCTNANPAVCTTTKIPIPPPPTGLNAPPGSGGQYESAQMYRVTVKITGPKNLESYVQALYSK
ncbi:MAG: hypothetical protein H6R07_351 [Proteobacteria bacterium]|nr:hypothetical protein [Pseudomonadota bacterium]